jgi:isopentenyldiphosphate isomerase
MADEVLDYFDENYKRQGSAPKSRTQAEGLWVQSFHCWMLHPGGSPTVLLQKRASTKALFPNCLDISAAGHLRAGEKVEDGVREITEETGLKIKYGELVSLGVKLDVAKFNNITNRQFCNVFLYANAPTIADMALDKTELDGMVEVTVDDGLKLFSGAVEKIAAKGVEKEKGLIGSKWRKIEKLISTADFIPRVDPYYYKIFIICDLYLKGFRHLAI